MRQSATVQAAARRQQHINDEDESAATLLPLEAQVGRIHGWEPRAAATVAEQSGSRGWLGAKKVEKWVWQPTTIWPPERPHGPTKVIEVSNGTPLTFG